MLYLTFCSLILSYRTQPSACVMADNRLQSDLCPSREQVCREVGVPGTPGNALHIFPSPERGTLEGTCVQGCETTTTYGGRHVFILLFILL